MGAHPLPRPVHERRDMSADVIREFVGRAVRLGQVTGGHRNQGYVLPLTDSMARLVGREAGTSVIVRIRRTEAWPGVIRTWNDEARILHGIRGSVPHAPECLIRRGGFSIHSHVEGVPLSAVCGNDEPVAPSLAEELVGLLAQTSKVRLGSLPPLPAVWPRNHMDSQGFLRMLARLVDRQFRQPDWHAFGGLFKVLGIPEDALIGFAERVPAMARRPYSLLHADLHRDNLIMTYDGHQSLVCLGWELATYGDPLHDLATHLVRMRYPGYQWAEVVDAWAEAMTEVRPSAVVGVAKDLRHYVAFERAQSAYSDVLRTVRSLEQSFPQKSLGEATAEVRRALAEAQEPLLLGHVPSEGNVEGALVRWLASRRGPDLGGLDAEAFGWKPDRRLPAAFDFPDSAVRDALLTEGAAPAGRVFRGTAHVNTVVPVPGNRFHVVVRRRLADIRRREPSFLSEYAVLRAIEDSGARMAVPRILALGESHPREFFAVHTYVGHPDVDSPPNHPVHGLMPHEADGLVDQLSALTHVNYWRLDPAAGEGGFFCWLRAQLVLLVSDLPRESQRLARLMGLPDAERLQQILSRHRVSERRSSLLHGDLNPWNLVRRNDDLALTIIDWEMAVVGDPLYDLVRHMHLTPTRPEIRDRMFRRWESTLGPEYSLDWRRDWREYRLIEVVRSAYIDLDRMVTGASLDAPNVRRAVESYPMTLAAALGALGLPVRWTATPSLATVLV
ncbi:phosphotransferase family protein [Streptomyces sp. NPDC007808]|uniref:phosphotransferase family protein n=1 Tax=Streptomyces sp. NPDC007808 TaxID=3364779 RepID=UPI0036918D7E